MTPQQERKLLRSLDEAIAHAKKPITTLAEGSEVIRGITASLFKTNQIMAAVIAKP